MLDGPAAEAMTPPVAFRPQSNDVSFQHDNSRVAFERQPGKPTLERKSRGANFTELPPHLRGDDSPQRQEKSSDQPSPEEMQLMQMLMNQAKPEKKAIEQPPPVEKLVVPVNSKTVEKSEVKTPVVEKKDEIKLPEKLKVVWEKVKAIAKKVWYYGSGSFIWDKIFS